MQDVAVIFFRGEGRLRRIACRRCWRHYTPGFSAGGLEHGEASLRRGVRVHPVIS